MSYIETLLHAHHMSLRSIFFTLEMEAGLALLEARAARLNPKGASGFIDRAVYRARDRARSEIEKNHTIIP